MKLRFKIIKRLKKYIKLVKFPLICLLLCKAATLPISFISPKMFQIFIDDVINKGATNKFILVVSGLLIVYVLKLFIDGLSLCFTNKTTNTLTYNLRKDIISKFSKSEFSFLEKKTSGELKLRVIDDVDKTSSFLQSQIVNYFYSIIMSISAFVLIFRISIKMTLYCIMIIPLIFIINNIIGNKLKIINEEIRMAKSDYTTSTHNSLQFWREIKIHTSENLFVQRFKKHRDKLAALGYKHIKFWACKEVFKDFKSNYLTKIMIYIVGAFFVIDKKITVGELLMFSQYYSLFFSSVEGINNKNNDLKINYPHYERIFDTFDFPEEKTNIEISDFKNKIEFNNVSFSYDKQNKVLKNINFSIEHGEYIAIIGQTGCGKSTLIKLLVGLYKEYDGEIFIDGIERKNILDSSFYNQIGIVMQDAFIFNMSIKDNLIMYNSNATISEINDACKKANIYDFITTLPNGIDTIIGEKGIKLSGGQRQRILIAAALLKNPKIIIFDEATSSLDTLSERIINNSINEFSKYITTIVITHRPSTILNAKKIVVLENGEIVGIGNHSDLVASNEYYNKIMENVI